MKIIVSAKNIELTPGLEQYIGEKINGLSKLIRLYEESGVAEARIEVSKTSRHHKQGEVYYAEANLKLPGSLLRAESTNLDMYSTIDEIKDELARQIKAYKERKSVKRRKGARELKEKSMK
ncbi:MAG: ribosome-associated translation inhibitor RaiA [Parcubacteria group bacterium]|nr:ribosome-associated translation inhibitor RaiA [Parcubacteria group bacterium]